MSPALYRQWIREVLAMVAPFSATDALLMKSVADLAGGVFDVSEFRRALEWNLAQDYIRSAENPDTDAREWRLTPRGEAKES